jgi:hypothetical protein
MASLLGLVLLVLLLLLLSFSCCRMAYI